MTNIPDSSTPPDSSLVVYEPDLGNTARASWPVSLADLRGNLAHCDEKRRETIIAAFCWCVDPQHPVRREEFATQVDYDPNTVYKVITGRYRNPDGSLLDIPEKLARNAAKFLELERERWLGGQTVFVETPTSRRIATLCELVRESRTIGFVWGPSHCGKTWALEHHKHENNHGRTFYARLKAASGLGGMLRVLSKAVGNSENANSADMTERIKRALTKDTLLIVDEMHELTYTYRKESFFACLEVIREIFDEVGCGMVLCGTRLMMENVEAARQGELEQMYKRGVHRLNLTSSPTKADVAAVLAASRLELPKASEEVTLGEGKATITEKPFEVIRQLAKRDGLRSITERLRYGRKIANKAKRKLDWSHFIEAHLTIESQAQPQESGWEAGR